MKARVEGTYCHYYKTKLLLAVPGLIFINSIFLVKFWFISGKLDLRGSNLYTCTCKKDSERFIHRVSNWWDRVMHSISSLIRLSIVIIQNCHLIPMFMRTSLYNCVNSLRFYQIWKPLLGEPLQLYILKGELR